MNQTFSSGWLCPSCNYGTISKAEEVSWAIMCGKSCAQIVATCPYCGEKQTLFTSTNTIVLNGMSDLNDVVEME